MEYPHKCEFKVEKLFNDLPIEITLYSGLTVLIGANASGKTKTLKALRDYFKNTIDKNSVRYLSSNRIGLIEQYRSKVNRYSHNEDELSIGDQNEKKARKYNETATGDLFTMDERKDVFIKVSERLSVLFNRRIYLRWNSGNMKVFFGKTDSEEEYSIAAEASGLINIISLLAALFDEEVKVLLIDEPEVSLHPQLQSYLLREIKKASVDYNKTIIIATHSTEMIDLNNSKDISNLVFFSANDSPKQISPDSEVLQSSKLHEFVLRMSQIYKTGFFANKVLLIEGVSDLIICRHLTNIFNLNIDVAGTQMIPIDGKGQFPLITKFFRLIGKEIIILTDLDGFLDDNSLVDLFAQQPNAIKLANQYGSGNIYEMIRSIKTRISSLILSHKDDMQFIYQTNLYWINKKDDDDENKVLQRAFISQLFITKNLDTWLDKSEWISVRTQLCAIFKILNAVGCFVLKKGTIESYYISSFKINIGKPACAVEEINTFSSVEKNTISEIYSDVVCSLKYAALIKEIDESNAIKEELLSELAVALELLPRISNVNEIYSALKQIKGNNVSLFKYEVLEVESVRCLEVNLNSAIIETSGFPFRIFPGNNVNQVVNEHIKQKTTRQKTPPPQISQNC